MSEKSSALAELLGSPAEKATLGCEELQKNSRFELCSINNNCI